MAKKVRDVVEALESHGWQQIRQRGSHRQFKHPQKPLVITIAGKPGATMKVGQLGDVRRKSGIEELR